MESLGVRKGAWSQKDVLLRKCVEKYGEGKWNQVPAPRAGLNRCRKSCRLRWVNYLKPDIKRGEFALDEVDLVIRLHNLLGNRWSLIAGRLPGRTANDVKNYWHTHHFKKKPRPYKFSKTLPRFELKTKAVDTFDTQVSTSSKPSSTSQQPNDDIIWWESLLDGHAQRGQETDFSTRKTTGTTDCMVEQIQGGEGDFPFWDTPNTQAKDLI
ncbi:hypothetical protein AAG906_035790 [Vitis piasezkii]